MDHCYVISSTADIAPDATIAVCWESTAETYGRGDVVIRIRGGVRIDQVLRILRAAARHVRHDYVPYLPFVGAPSCDA
jgi:hypothetical protein